MSKDCKHYPGSEFLSCEGGKAPWVRDFADGLPEIPVDGYGDDTFDPEGDLAWSVGYFEYHLGCFDKETREKIKTRLVLEALKA